jgi:hypothetical protein
MSIESIQENKNKESKLLGNKIKQESEIDNLDENNKICNICNMEKNSFIKCTECNKYYCLNCINSKINDKIIYEHLISDNKKNDNWVCFECDNHILNSIKNNKCLLCGEKSNLIDYEKIIQNLSYSQKEKKKLKEKNELLKKVIENKGNLLLCNICLEKNSIIKQFLDNKLLDDTITDKNDDENKTKENIFNVLDKQSETINSQNKKINSLNTNKNEKDIEHNNTINYPIINNIQEGRQNVNNNINSPKTNLNIKINELIPNIDDNIARNNLGELQNISQLTGITNSMFNNNIYNNNINQNNLNLNNNNSSNKKDEKKDDSTNSIKSMKNYMMNIIDDLKNQINEIQYNNQLQKYFIGYIMEYLEIFMEQISNQNFINQQKTNIFQNQTPNNLFNMNFPTMNPSLMNNNNMMKQMNFPMMSFNYNNPNNQNITPNIINQNEDDKDKKNYNIMFNNSTDDNKDNNNNNLFNMFNQNNQFLNPTIDPNLFRQFTIPNQIFNPQSFLFNNQNNNINNNESIPISHNINNLSNIGNINNMAQDNSLMFQMVFNQGQKDSNDKCNINNSQIKKDK